MKNASAAALALLLATAAPALAAAESFTILFSGRPVGTLVATPSGTGTTIAYDYKNNGRGPTVAETLAIDSDGLPTGWTIKGSTTFGSAIDERFSRTGTEATWVDAAGPGSAQVKGKALYVAQSASPWALGLYARALHNAGGRLAALPAGELSLETVERLDLAGPDGKVPVTAVTLSGIDLDKQTLFLDGKRQLVAYATPEFIVIRKGLEGEEARLRKLVAGWDTKRLSDYQKSLAHRPAGALRVQNVRVFQPETMTLSAPSSVIVRGNRIAAVEPAATTPAAGETVVDGKGGVLIAGFHEMHAHLGQSDALTNLLAGITTVRDMGNDDAVLDSLVARIEAGELAGPRVVRSGFIEGKSATNAQNGVVVSTEAEALEAVRDAAKRGVFQIKIYSSIKPEWVPAMIKEAHALGLRVAGHIPAFTTTDAMIEAGYDEVTHSNQMMLNWVLKPGDDTRTLLRITALQRLGGFDLDQPAPQKTLKLVADRKVAHDPTLIIMETATRGRRGSFPPGAADWGPNMPVGMQRDLKQPMLAITTPEEDKNYSGAFDTTLETIRRLHKAGVMIVPGTDMGGNLWYHRELELYTMAGMTNGEVLKRATADMAQYLGRADRFGRIAPGMTADFVLLEQNPLDDIKATKSASMVVKDGVVYFPTEGYQKLGIKPFAGKPEVSGARFAK
jgi:imidazolonepropionase-like amidohydrolase